MNREPRHERGSRRLRGAVAPTDARHHVRAAGTGGQTARVVWECSRQPIDYGFAMGYVQRFANGNTLIGWGFGKPDVTEVDSTGTEVFSLSFPAGWQSYRAYRFVPPARETTHVVPPPPALALSPDRPNPFAGATDLALDLPEDAAVTLRVYDVEGREVATVADRVPYAAGRYQAHVDLSGRRPGLYFCRLTVGAVSRTRAIVMVR